MAILCFVLFVIAAVIFLFTVSETDTFYDSGAAALAGIGITFMVVFGIAAVIFAGIGIHGIVDNRYIDQKIQAYEEENERIEKDVDFVVAKYMEHENQTFDMSEVESSTVLVQMYPELKSNELVSKQMDIYNENNKKIKKLKIEKIENQKAKFYLYFGK